MPKPEKLHFKALNRIVYTNNKAFKFRKRPDPYCEQCGDIKTVATSYIFSVSACASHNSSGYAYLDELVMQFLNINAWGLIPRVELSSMSSTISHIPH